MATVVPTRQPSSFWASVREALRGSRQDYTQGSLTRAIFLLAVPMVIEMLMESLFAIVDVFWVARLGAESIATVGLVEAMLTLVYATGMGLGLSATAMVARRIGEKDHEGAAVAGVQAIALALLAGLAVGAPCLHLAPHLLRLMGASPAVLVVGSRYARITTGGCSVVLLLIMNNAVFRGAGDAAIAMRVLWLANALNLLLDPCLIFGLGPFPRLGVTGAAVATLTGRSVGVLYQFYCLLRGGEHIRVLVRQVRQELCHPQPLGRQRGIRFHHRSGQSRGGPERAGGRDRVATPLRRKRLLRTRVGRAGNGLEDDAIGRQHAAHDQSERLLGHL